MNKYDTKITDTGLVYTNNDLSDRINLNEWHSLEYLEKHDIWVMEEEENYEWNWDSIKDYVYIDLNELDEVEDKIRYLRKLYYLNEVCNSGEFLEFILKLKSQLMEDEDDDM